MPRKLQLTTEQRYYLSDIMEQGKKLDIAGICIEHPALRQLGKKGLIKADSRLKKGRIVYWRLTEKGKKLKMF